MIWRKPSIVACLLVLAAGSACSSQNFSGSSASKKDDGGKNADDGADDGEAESSDTSTETDTDTDIEGETDTDTATETDIEQDETETVASKRKKCGTAAERTKTVTLDFPSTEGQVCKWGEDGNLSSSSGSQTRAIAEQRKTFSLEKGALCGVSFDGGSSTVQYDDFMLFTFDGFVLASAQFTEAELLAMGMEKKGSLIEYDRLKHIGKGPYDGSMNSRTNAICPAGGSCQTVKSNTAGSLSIDAPKSWFDLLPEGTLKAKEHDLTVWVTGQGHSSDCQHSGMSFELTLTYVE